MTEPTSYENKTTPICTWCRVPIIENPHYVYILGKPLAAFCSDCHANGYKAATGLIALSHALTSKRKLKKEKTDG